MTLRAVLSVGSNVGDSRALVAGVAAAARRDGMLRAESSPLVTEPWGGVEQPPFVNSALLVTWEGTPAGLLDWCRDREREAHRTREVRWGPRTLDVDVVTVWEDGRELRSDDPGLTLPHPRAGERAFVLVPWREIDPDATLRGRPLGEYLDALGADAPGVLRNATGGEGV